MSETRMDEMVNGYLAGFRGLPIRADASPAMKHGWKNGNADRTGTPVDRASVMLARANMILGDEAALPHRHNQPRKRK